MNEMLADQSTHTDLLPMLAVWDARPGEGQWHWRCYLPPEYSGLPPGSEPDRLGSQYPENDDDDGPSVGGPGYHRPTIEGALADGARAMAVVYYCDPETMAAPADWRYDLILGWVWGEDGQPECLKVTDPTEAIDLIRDAVNAESQPNADQIVAALDVPGKSG